MDFVTTEDPRDFSMFLDRVYSHPSKEAYGLALRQKDNSLLFVQLEALAASSGQECRMAMIDINERKLAAGALLRNSKLESLGLLAGGIATTSTTSWPPFSATFLWPGRR
jgi:hypothetical protein